MCKISSILLTYLIYRSLNYDPYNINDVVIYLMKRVMKVYDASYTKIFWNNVSKSIISKCSRQTIISCVKDLASVFPRSEFTYLVNNASLFYLSMSSVYAMFLCRILEVWHCCIWLLVSFFVRTTSSWCYRHYQLYKRVSWSGSA